MKNNNNFFEWFVGLFKKEPPPVVILPSPEEVEANRKWEALKAKYRLEYVESFKAFFIQYYWREEWWYIRKWNEDYTFEKVRGSAMRISTKDQLDTIIYLHQDWIKEGHIFLN